MRRAARPSFVMPDDEINFKDCKKLALRMHIAQLNKHQRQAVLEHLAARVQEPRAPVLPRPPTPPRNAPVRRRPRQLPALPAQAYSAKK